jgi:Fic family protein
MKITPKDEFEFLNSSTWLEYTQRRYISPDEIRHRLNQQGNQDRGWFELEKKIQINRKVGSVPLFMPCVEKKFWYFPSDSIARKIEGVESLGRRLFSQISQHSSFSKDFLLDSTIEEAITSAIYEGAHTTRAQAQQLIASGKKPSNKDEWMLINNLRAMTWVHEHKQTALSEGAILEIHKIVTENTMEGDDVNFIGKFRNDKVYIGDHEGVEHSKISECIKSMIDVSINNPRYIHPLVQGILIHYFTAYIHPFFDGNGRTARALFYFNSMQKGLDYVQLLSVSAYLKTHGKRYEKTFEKAVQWDLDVTYFVDFCLDSIHFALGAVDKKVQYLLQIVSLQKTENLTSNQIGLIQRLALHKFRQVSIEEYAHQINMSREVARQELKALSEKKLLTETTVGKKFVYGINKDLLDSLLKREAVRG